MSMLNKVRAVLRKPSILIIYLSANNYLNWLPDKLYLHIMYRIRTGRKLNLKKPTKFNEYLQIMKLSDRDPILTTLVDKYEVKRLVANKIGKDYLIPTLGIYEKFEEIDFDKLPNQFVLKCTHDSGGIVICKDKTNFNIKQAQKKINKHLSRNYYYKDREWPYKNIKPRIICEQYMVDESGVELKDYKIFCFNGTPEFIQVDFGRFSNHRRNLYTTEWELIPVSIDVPNDPKVKVTKPKKLDELLELSKMLSAQFKHVRVDFYIINGKIYFGEMTFYHGSGYHRFYPDTFNEYLGSLLTKNKESVEK